MIFFVDFDGTIFPNSQDAPYPECLEVLNRIKAAHNYIHIYSCRSCPGVVTDPVAATADMEKYLKEHNVPYDKVVWGKPLFNYIIDDRAIGVPLDASHSVDWKVIKEKIGKILLD
jgi:phosphoglycolate phosphatase-like HAD superfamily hydrolase